MDPKFDEKRKITPKRILFFSAFFSIFDKKRKILSPCERYNFEKLKNKMNENFDRNSPFTPRNYKMNSSLVFDQIILF